MRLVILHVYRAQMWQFHRRFDKCQSWDLKTDLVQLHTVWSVSRRCTQWNNCLAVLPGQPTTVQIRHRSDTTECPLRPLWSWIDCKRYENVEYQYSSSSSSFIAEIFWYKQLTQTAVQYCYFSTYRTTSSRRNVMSLSTVLNVKLFSSLHSSNNSPKFTALHLAVSAHNLGFILVTVEHRTFWCNPIMSVQYNAY